MLITNSAPPFRSIRSLLLFVPFVFFVVSSYCRPSYLSQPFLPKNQNGMATEMNIRKSEKG